MGSAITRYGAEMVSATEAEKWAGTAGRKELLAAAAVAEELGLPVYLVGGPVRDLLLAAWGRLDMALPLDLDLVVEGDGILFARKLAQRLGAKPRVHKRFQTANLELPEGRKVDVATARRETYAHPAAPPRVERCSIEEDLQRRDFSLNALAIRLRGEGDCELVDVTGGREDLREGRIRVLHDDSFVDDPSRVLRAVRFEQRFDFVVERRTSALMDRAVQEGLVGRLSGPKRLQELTLILKETEPLKCIRRLGELGLLKVFHPALCVTPRLLGLFEGVRDGLGWHRRVCPEWEVESWRVYLMALFESVVRSDGHAQEDCARIEATEGQVRGVCERLCLPAGLARELKEVGLFMALWDLPEKSPSGDLPTTRKLRASTPNLRKAVEALHGISRPEAGKRLSRGQWGRILRPFSREVLLFLRAGIGEERAREALSLYLAELMEVEPCIRGEDLVRLGLKPGPRYKEILEKTRELKMDGVLRTRQEEIRFVQEQYLGGDEMIAQNPLDLSNSMQRSKCKVKN